MLAPIQTHNGYDKCPAPMQDGMVGGCTPSQLDAVLRTRIEGISQIFSDELPWAKETTREYEIKLVLHRL